MSRMFTAPYNSGKQVTIWSDPYAARCLQPSWINFMKNLDEQEV